MKYPILILIIFLIAVVSAAFVIVQKKDTQVMVIDVVLAKPIDNNSQRIISQVNASMSQVKKMEIPLETPVLIPGITILVIQDMQEKSGWYSIPLPSSGSIYGSHRLSVRVSDIDISRPVRILTRVIDPLGKEVSVKASDIMVS